MLKRCRIQKYDPAVTEAPFRFITLVECAEVNEPEGLNDGGSEFANRLADMCQARGYKFRFYSMHRDDRAAPGVEKVKLNRKGASPDLKPNIDYDVTVEGELEEKLGILSAEEEFLLALLGL
jgi:hypothetical protein